MLVAFGPTPESYVVAAGRRFFCEGMPPSLLNKLKTDLPVLQLDWISVDNKAETWVAHDFVTDIYHFDIQLNPIIRAHLEGKDGKARAEYITFPAETGSYFIKHVERGGWDADLEERYVNCITGLRHKVHDFDLELTGIIFGKDSTHIYQLENGFHAFVEGEADDTNHILYKTILDFQEKTKADETPWLIQKGSALCQYDSRFFFLAFKQSGNPTTQYRWNLPQGMSARFNELRSTAELPEEQIAISSAQQQIDLLLQQRLNLKHQILMTQLRMQQDTVTAVHNFSTVVGVGLVNAAGGHREVVYR